MSSRHGSTVAIAVLAVLLSACSDGRSAPDPEPEPDPEPAATVDPPSAVWRVVATACGTEIEALATGVAVAEDLVVTVAHTFEGAATVELADGNGAQRRWPAEVAYLDPARDIAVLRISDQPGGEPLAWLPLGDAGDGDVVSVITAAGDDLASKSATVIRHVAVTLDGEGRRAGLQIGADIDLGDSGSPVVTAEGVVAGIVFAADRDELKGWAVAAAEVESALAQLSAEKVTLSC